VKFGKGRSVVQRKLIYVLCGLVVATLLAGVISSGQLSAQESATATPAEPPTPTPIPTATAFPLQRLNFTLLAASGVELTTDGPAVVRAATIGIGAGQSTLPFTNEGATVLVVTAGSVVVVSDAAVVSVVDIGVIAGLAPVAASPGPIDAVTVATGEQIYLPAGSTTEIRNGSRDQGANLLIVSIVPV
jgi:hypothetical protein